MLRKAQHRLLAATACLLLAACSTMPWAGRGSEDEEVEALRRRLVEVQKRATVAELEADRLREEVAELETELAARQAPAAAVVEPVEIDPPGGQGPIEEQELEDAPEEEAEPPAAAAPSAASEPAQVLYDRGYTLFHQQRYEAAESLFERFLTTYPESDLADNAQFWIGECRWARGDYRGALGAFTATVERFPGGNKVADSMLKAGKCLEALGEGRSAVETYREVVNRFSGTAAAAEAETRLSVLD